MRRWATVQFSEPVDDAVVGALVKKARADPFKDAHENAHVPLPDFKYFTTWSGERVRTH